MTDVTVVIPARDEELHVARCVESATELGRVVVVDGGSRDRTRELASRHGAEVVEHFWTGYAAQKNWALDEVVTTEWVLFLDADEYLTARARVEILAALRDAGVAGYYLPRSYVFLGKRLDHAWWYPDYQLRLFRRTRGRYEERRVHEHVIVDGPVGTLEEAIIHDNLKGLTAFVERHNRYSDLEAEELLAPSPQRRPGSFTGVWADRRRALKDTIWFRLPGRPLIRFAWLYLVKGGFLDGRRGLLFSQLIAMYDFLIDAKVRERRLLEEGRDAPQRSGLAPGPTGGEGASDAGASPADEH
jgi:glycosyltransferase involved in cell wall biosynthesis